MMTSVTIPANSALSQAFSADRPLAIIAAVAQNRIIGGNNTLLWRLSDDLKRFRALTTGHSVIMGRKTWESLPRALPERQNIVITHSCEPATIRARGGEAVGNLADAIAAAHLPAPIFCIGGGEIYRLALPRTAVLYLTEIARDFDGDTYFPEWSPTEWQRIAYEPHQEGDLRYAFATYLKKKNFGGNG